MAILCTHNLTVGYGRGDKASALLTNLNLELNEGTLTALLGRNGAGKSTLLRAITRGDKPLAGSITVNGSDITTMNRRHLSHLVAIVTTERVSVGALTVREVVELGRQPHTGYMGRLSESDHTIVNEAISLVGISELAHKMMSQLSDGERQKVMIARALAQQTPIIVLDEPTAFLDVASRIETMQLLARLAHDNNKAVLLSSHDVSQSLSLADYLWIVTENSEVITGATQSLLHTDALNTMFLNRNIRFNPTLLDFEYHTTKNE